MRPELVIFDMDGTLADTSPGIFESYRHVARHYGLPEPSDGEMSERMGGALQDNICELFGFDRAKVQEATDVYREFYGREGYLMSVLFPGISELLDVLRDEGYLMSIATMKIHEYAVQQVEEWGIGEYFVSVNGTDRFSMFGKSALIDRALYSAGAAPADAVMVGDSPNDLFGAQESGVPFIAVTYGFGFTREVCESNGIPYAEAPMDIAGMVRRSGSISRR